MNALHFTILKAQVSDIDAITTLHSTITEKFVPTIVPAFCKYSDISVTVCYLSKSGKPTKMRKAYS
jgi:hypothetical protein